MKFSTILAVSFFMVSFILSAVFGGYSIYLGNDLLIRHIRSHLIDVIYLKTELVEGFLKVKKTRAVDFSSDGLIKNSLVELSNGSDSIQVMEDLSYHLVVNKLPLEEDFYEVFVLDANGKLVGTTNPETKFGTNFSTNHIFLEGKKQAYLMETFFDEEFGHKGIALSAPISGEKEFLGVVVIKLLPESLYEVTSGEAGFEKTEDIYIINNEKFLITPSKFLKGESKGILVQKVDTENAEDCFEEGVIGHAERDEPIISFLDYRGEEVIGTHREILETNWCLLVEVDKEESLIIPLKELIKNQIIAASFIVVILTSIGFFVGKLLDKKYILKLEIK